MNRFSGVLITAGLTLAASDLSAQNALEEVIVTAQKREQSLQDIPVAITAFSESDIVTRGIRDVKDIGLFVPNVQIAPSPGISTGATVAIRGSTTINPALTWEPTVGLYLDGVFLGKNLGGIFDVAELARVEVLRGPQGTLYGKNTLGGAINLITKTPAAELGGYVEGSIGNEGYTGVRGRFDTGAIGAVGQGLGEFRASFAYASRSRDGFYDNIDLDPTGGFNPFVNAVSSDTFQDMESDALRLDLSLAVSDALELRYSYDDSSMDKRPNMGQLTDVSGPAFEAFGLGFLGDLQALYVTPGTDRAEAISNDEVGYERSDVSGHALTVTFNWNDITLKSITANRELEWSDKLDIDGTPMNLFTSTREVDYEQFSQEFQLSGGNDALNWVAGLYYFSEEGDVYNPIEFFGLFGSPADNNEYGLDNSSWAVYGQADWDLTPSLTLTAGVRYTDEEKEQYILHPNASTGGVGAFGLTAEDSWSNTTATAVLSYRLGENTSVYAKAAQGWKAGGFNGEAPSAEAFLESYEPEEVDAYELGLKSRFLNDRIQLNAAAFINVISDMQFSVFLEGSGGAASTVANAGAATVKGLELELAAQVSENFRIGLNYGYLDTEYDEFIELGQDVRNQKDFPYAPESTASLDLDWSVMALAWGQLSLHVDWSYKDSFVPYTNKDQNFTSQIKPYDVVNARLTLGDVALGGSVLEVSLWGKNVFDEEYRENTIPFGLWTISYWGEPATYGLDARISF